MELIKALGAFSNYLPEINLSSGSDRALRIIEPEIEPKKYLSACLVSSFLFSFGIWILCLLMGSDIIISSAILLFLFAVLFFLLLKLPSIQLNEHVKRIDIELPFALRKLALLIDFGLPFEKALSLVASEKSALGQEMSLVLRDIESGVNTNKALFKLAERIPSQQLKRAILQLTICYEHGQKGKEIKIIADELLKIQNHQLKEAATRSSTFGLIFIASAALFPTFFMMLFVLSPVLIETSISEEQFMIATLVLFPLISALLLYTAKKSLPTSVFRTEKRAESGFLFLTPVIVLSMVFLEPPLNYVVLIGGVLLLFALLYKKYNEDKKIESIDFVLPDALFNIATLPKGSSFEKLLAAIEKGNYGPLSDEASASLRQLKAGVKVEKILDDFAARGKSKALERALRMIGYAINTNSLNRLSEVADDLLKFLEIKRERITKLSMQKYTLILGGILLPLILKTTLCLSGEMSNVISQNQGNFSALAQRIIPAYLIIYASLVSRYISDVEEQESKLFIYFTFLAAAGIIIFSLVSI